jgi:hypothetical protein
MEGAPPGRHGRGAGAPGAERRWEKGLGTVEQREEEGTRRRSLAIGGNSPWGTGRAAAQRMSQGIQRPHDFYSAAVESEVGRSASEKNPASGGSGEEIAVCWR